MSGVLKIVFWGLVLTVYALPAAAAGIEWRPFRAGMQMAGQENKHIYLYFKAGWCPSCEVFERTTLQEEAVIRFLNDHFISIKVDGDNEPRLLKTYQVRGYPDNLFLDGHKKVVYRRPGALEPMVFLFFLDYIRSRAYKTMTPMQYYESR